MKYASPDSPIQRVLADNNEPIWGVSEYLLAAVLDTLAGANWQRGGGKGKRPQPVPRPGDQHQKRGDVMPAAEMADWLGPDWYAPSD